MLLVAPAVGAERIARREDRLELAPILGQTAEQMRLAAPDGGHPRRRSRDAVERATRERPGLQHLHRMDEIGTTRGDLFPQRADAIGSRSHGLEAEAARQPTERGMR